MTAPPRHGARAARVALVSTYFTMFDEQMPAGFRAEREQVARRYADAVGEHFDVTYAGLLTSEADGIAANDLLRAVEPDAVVFAPAMAAPPAYAARALDGIVAPLVVWNAPTHAHLGADLTQALATVNTTQVGCVMLANVLVRTGRPFSVVTAAPGDPAGTDRLVRTIRAAAAAGRLRGATVLRVGEPVAGYLDVACSEGDLRRLCVQERSVPAGELERAFDAAGDDAAERLLGELEERGFHRVKGDADVRSARLALALDGLVAESGAACVSVNCHSGLLRDNARIGITACLAASLLTERGVPVSCTGDAPTALALRLARELTGRALYCEFYAPEPSTGLMLLAAGGEGDPAWADPARPIVVEPNTHYPGRHGAGAALGFGLEPGPATVLSLSPTADGWRLAWATGEVVEARYARMGGPNGMFRFDSGDSDVAGARWIASGATHHNALARGRLEVEIPVLADALGVEAVRV